MGGLLGEGGLYCRNSVEQLRGGGVTASTYITIHTYMGNIHYPDYQDDQSAFFSLISVPSKMAV